MVRILGNFFSLRFRDVGTGHTLLTMLRKEDYWVWQTCRRSKLPFCGWSTAGFLMQGRNLTVYVLFPHDDAMRGPFV